MPRDVVELDRISDYPAYWAERRPGAEAMVLGAYRLSYAELAATVDRAARALFAAGVRRGDRVAALGPPRPETLILFLAVARLGAMFTGLNARFKIDEMRYVLGDAEPCLLIAFRAFHGRDYATDIDLLVGETKSIRRVVLLGHREEAPGEGWAEFLGEGDAVDTSAYAAAIQAVAPGDAALLVYTSGSTGRPKGAMLSHRGLCHCLKNQCDHWWADPLRVLNNLPISNVFCLGDLFCFTLIGGGCSVFMERLDAAAIWRVIEAERVTLWGQVPTMLQLALANPAAEAHDRSSLQTVFWAGARAPRALIQALAKLAPKLSTNYGLTETTSGVVYTRVDASMEELEETVGRADPHYQMRVVGPDGREVPEGEPGEIQVRGACHMVGYWRRPEASAQMIDAEGWLHSGDLGLRRPDGNFRIVGRLSDMFKSGGFNVYPREIELVLETHPAVAMAAVVGVPDQLYGEVGHAYVLGRTEPQVDGPTLEAWCRERLANFKVPKRFVVRADLPMLAVGKIDKALLKREAAAGVKP